MNIPNFDNTLKWLENLVAFDTRNGVGNELECLEYLKASLDNHSPDEMIFDKVTRSRGKSESGYVMARWGTPKVLLNVHIDTVPSGEGWRTDPHKLSMAADKVIGLGTSDIKGAAACILAAMDQQTPQDVAVLFSGDEEHGSEVMPEIIKRRHYGGAKMAIVCEPTNCKVGRRHRGMLAMSAEFKGKGGHSSLSDVTERPLLQAARLATAFGYYGDQNIEFGEVPYKGCLLYTSPSPRDRQKSRMPSSA